MIDLEGCITLDEQDVLDHFREQFVLDDSVIYLNGNSLGVLPKATAARMQKVVTQEWGEGLIRSWNTHDWIHLPQRLGGKIAHLIGAKPEEVIVCDSTSINLFKLAAAALKLRPGRHKILTEPGNFPTDLYMLQGLISFIGSDIDIIRVPAHEILHHIDEDTALVCLTHVHYKSGHMLDMATLTAAAHQSGALMMWDLSHSTGAVPLELNRFDVDFAVGCGYKYLNGGPGAPAFLYVNQRHLSTVQQPLTGWFGHANAFAMLDDYQAAPGIEKMLCGTTPVIAASALEVGIDIFLATNMSALRSKSLALSRVFIELMTPLCQQYGFLLITPTEDNQRGSQVSYQHPHGYAIMQALIDRQVIGDFRAPDVLRFGFAPLYIRFVDVWWAVQHLETIMHDKLWQQAKYQIKHKVT